MFFCDDLSLFLLLSPALRSHASSFTSRKMFWERNLFTIVKGLRIFSYLHIKIFPSFTYSYANFVTKFKFKRKKKSPFGYAHLPRNPKVCENTEVICIRKLFWFLFFTFMLRASFMRIYENSFETPWRISKEIQLPCLNINGKLRVLV